MTSFPCSTAAQAVQYATLVSSYRSHPNQAFYQNKLLLTLFDGAYCTFGQANVNAGWAYFRAQMTARNTPVYIMPSLFVDLAQHNWYDGHFDWDNSWPKAGQDLDGSRDVQAKAQMTARGKGYMPGISPNFFTYYSPQTYNKNWIYRSDDWLMASRFEQIIQQRASHDMAELITWNGEFSLDSRSRSFFVSPDPELTLRLWRKPLCWPHPPGPAGKLNISDCIAE